MKKSIKAIIEWYVKREYLVDTRLVRATLKRHGHNVKNANKIAQTIFWQKIDNKNK